MKTFPLSGNSKPHVHQLLVIGSAASGIATVAEFIRHPRFNARPGDEILLVDKSNRIASGLAYGTTNRFHILNMSAETMGIKPDAPGDFKQWMATNFNRWSHIFPEVTPSEKFPPRVIYAMYLHDQFLEVKELAESMGVRIRLIASEATDVIEKGDHCVVKFLDGQKYKAKQVVMAVGHLPSNKYWHLAGKPGYLSSPFVPRANSVLSRIGKNTPVILLGTGLTGIDSFLLLEELGHRGPVWMLSRSGMLPNVQSVSSPSVDVTRIQRSVRRLLQQSVLTLRDIGECLSHEISLEGDCRPFDLDSWVTPHLPAADVLDEEIRLAQLGGRVHQKVLLSTAPIVEELWRRLPQSERQRFSQFQTLWRIVRHPMPLPNALRIQQAINDSRLTVFGSLDNVRFDKKLGMFEATCQGNSKAGTFSVAAPIVINATGESLDVAGSDIPLLQNMLASGTLVPHQNGGVEVDFDNHRAINVAGRVSNKISILGALTAGVFNYTSALDRVVAHSSRVANEIVYQDVSSSAMLGRSLEIAMFVGSDITSHCILNQLVPRLAADGHRISMYFPLEGKNQTSRPHLDEYSEMERGLLNRWVLPQVNGRDVKTGVRMLSPRQLADRYDVRVENVPNVNSPEFVQLLRTRRTDLGLSIRCYQKFKTKVIEYFSEPNRLLFNLHPGLCPQYRGVSIILRAMADRQPEFGYTAHQIDDQFDTGDIIGQTRTTIDYDQCALSNMIGSYKAGAQLALDTIQDFAEHGSCIATPQPPGKIFTFMTEREYESLQKNGVTPVDTEAVRKTVLGLYGLPVTRSARVHAG